MARKGALRRKAGEIWAEVALRALQELPIGSPCDSHASDFEVDEKAGVGLLLVILSFVGRGKKEEVA